MTLVIRRAQEDIQKKAPVVSEEEIKQCKELHDLIEKKEIKIKLNDGEIEGVQDNFAKFIIDTVDPVDREKLHLPEFAAVRCCSAISYSIGSWAQYAVVINHANHTEKVHVDAKSDVIRVTEKIQEY
jgi:hypothetical protein